MKKYLVIFLIFSFVLVDFLRPLYFSLWQYNWRKQIRRELKTEIFANHLIKLTFSKKDLKSKNKVIYFVEEDEFRYNNIMYDIVSIEETADSIKYTCYQDIKEMMTITMLINITTNSGALFPLPPLLKTKLIHYTHYIAEVNVMFYTVFFKFSITQIDFSRILSRIIEVLTPPPEYCN